MYLFDLWILPHIFPRVPPSYSQISISPARTGDFLWITDTFLHVWKRLLLWFVLFQCLDLLKCYPGVFKLHMSLGFFLHVSQRYCVSRLHSYIFVCLFVIEFLPKNSMCYGCINYAFPVSANWDNFDPSCEEDKMCSLTKSVLSWL